MYKWTFEDFTDTKEGKKLLSNLENVVYCLKAVLSIVIQIKPESILYQNKEENLDESSPSYR